MSVPLDGIATHDTSERIKRAQEWHEYHRRAREELDRVLPRQQQEAAPPEAFTVPVTPTSTPASISDKPTLSEATPGATCVEDSVSTPPISPGTSTNTTPKYQYQLFPSTPVQPAFTSTPPARVLHSNSFSPATQASFPTPTKPPAKVASRVKEMFTPKKKTPPPSPSDVEVSQHAENLQNVAVSTPDRPRTADPKEGGQLSIEDSWDWYTRNMYATKPLPPLPTEGGIPVRLGVRSGRGAEPR